MYPTIIQIGSIPVIGGVAITSVGLFLFMAFLAGTFIIWRLGNLYEFDKEKLIDWVIYTSIAGFVGARLFYVGFNLNQFSSIWSIVAFYRYPGFMLWGGVLGAGLILYYFARRSKTNYFLILDFAFVGFILGYAVLSIGCLFGGCQYGLPSNLPIAVNQIGIVGRRFPVQILYSFLLFLSFIYLWRASLKFHFSGKIASISLIFLGVIQFSLQFLRGDQKSLVLNFTSGHFFALGSFILGFVLFYKLGKRSLLKDLRQFVDFFIDKRKRRLALLNFKKSCYNHWVLFNISLLKFKRKFSKKFNVKSNPTQF